MRVFLGNAPWRVENRLGVRAGCRWPFTLEKEKGQTIPGYVPFPFFLAYTTAVLKKQGIDAMIVDAIAEGIDDDGFIKRIKDSGSELVVLETSTPSIKVDLAIARRIKDETKAKICLCGPHVSVFKDKILKESPFVDYVAYGEYDHIIRDLAKALNEKVVRLKTVRGLVYRAKEGIRTNPPMPVIEDINELPWPVRDSLPMLNYRDGNAGLPFPSLQLVAGRGCPFKCSFCLWPSTMMGNRYRTRDPVDVVDELEYCIKKWKYKSFYFDDDTFNIGEQRIIKICEEMQKRGINLPWEAMARADTATPKMLEAMKDAGLIVIKYGVESGDQEVLNRIGKNLDLEKAEEMIKLTKKIGIKVHLTFTFGLPGESWETINKSIDYLMRVNPDSVQISINVPFPGTRYFAELEEKGLILTKDWSRYDGYQYAVMRTEKLSAEDLKKAVKIAHRKWTLKKMTTKKHYIIEGLRHPVRAARFLKRRIMDEEIY